MIDTGVNPLRYFRRLFGRPATSERGLTWDQAAAAGLLRADQQSSAGVTVSLDVALGQSPVWAALRLISTGVASLPLVVYRKIDHDDRERVPDHPAYQLVHDEPNEEMTPFSFWSAQVVQMLLYGAMAAEIERNGAGEPIALWPLPSERIQPTRPTPGGPLVYRFYGSSRHVDLSPQDVWYVPYLTLDGVEGLGILSHAREALGLNRAMESSAGSYFTNMIRPSGAVEAPPGMSENAVENIRRSVERVNSGHKATARLLMLFDGVKFNPYQISNQEAQWIEGRSFGIQEVARFFNISPTKLADLGRATWSNLESENQAFIDSTLLPILIGRDQETNRKLITREERGTLYAETLVEARLRGNTSERYACYQVGIQAGFLLRSEARKFENLPWVEGLDQPLVPVAIAQNQDPATTTDDEDDDEPDDDGRDPDDPDPSTDSE